MSDRAELTQEYNEIISFVREAAKKYDLNVEDMNDAPIGILPLKIKEKQDNFSTILGFQSLISLAFNDRAYVESYTSFGAFQVTYDKKGDYEPLLESLNEYKENHPEALEL